MCECSPKKCCKPGQTHWDPNKCVRNWVFRLSNYSVGELDQMKQQIINTARYAVIGKEVCPTTSTPHLQACVIWNTPKSFKTVCNYNKRIHWEWMIADIDCSFVYCTKEDKEAWIHGIKPTVKKPKPRSDVKNPETGQGFRSDLVELKDDIVSGKTKVDEIVMDKPDMYHEYGRTLERIEDLKLMNTTRTEITKGIWYWGETGVGKSHTAFQGFSLKTHYVHNTKDGGWWDGYKQQDTVIINEFRGEIDYSELLDLMDKWHKTVKRRNRQPIPFVSKLIIITSPLHPVDCYKNTNQDNIAQLLRRCKVIQLFGGTTTTTTPEVVIGNAAITNSEQVNNVISQSVANTTTVGSSSTVVDENNAIGDCLRKMYKPIKLN